MNPPQLALYLVVVALIPLALYLAGLETAAVFAAFLAVLAMELASPSAPAASIGRQVRLRWRAMTRANRIARDLDWLTMELVAHELALHSMTMKAYSAVREDLSYRAGVEIENAPIPQLAKERWLRVYNAASAKAIKDVEAIEEGDRVNIKVGQWGIDKGTLGLLDQTNMTPLEASRG